MIDVIITDWVEKSKVWHIENSDDRLRGIKTSDRWLGRSRYINKASEYNISCSISLVGCSRSTE